MKFKILKGTETFLALSAVKEKFDQVKAEAWALCQKLGGYDYVRSSHDVAGGIGGIFFDQQPPDGWKVVEPKRFVGCYYPRSIPKNKALLKEIAALPKVTNQEINEPVDFHFQVTPELMVVHRVEVVWGKDYHLVGVAEGCQYKPKPDMIEITYSEYAQLEKAITHENSEPSAGN
ncbi:hypothetical protein [Arsenicibacter rosenii]|uniref:Uncharacterized protein n=1 Tax=Arsenicibacter rosenii TaxID=1750698 RepID=A0A1S2VB33_9BACT|nr:hypothetical protein [Arsenicibacter rosenii]OIN55630.1 hypothetical protein BLX24_29030 [Arsenicibacter rosenii]